MSFQEGQKPKKINCRQCGKEAFHVTNDTVFGNTADIISRMTGFTMVVDPDTGLATWLCKDCSKTCWNCKHVRTGGVVFPCECLLKAMTSPDTACGKWEPKPPKIVVQKEQP